MVFTGTYEHTIDAKNRLAIPSEIRAVLADEPQEGNSKALVLYVMLGEGALNLYTASGLNRRAAELDHSELESDELLEIERLMFSNTARLEMDSQGRVRLPESMLKQAGLGTDVVLLGVKDHMEVRDRATWKAHVERVLKERPGILMNPRRAMRRPSPGTPSAPPTASVPPATAPGT